MLPAKRLSFLLLLPGLLLPAACATMDAIPDGQLYWVIRHGSPGTGMLAHAELSDEETWQVVAYIREPGR